MKKITLSTLFILAITISSFAQTWQNFNYQGVARDAQGAVIENQAVGIRISLHEGTAIGTVVYQETHAATTNEFGLFDLAIGGGTVISGTFGTIDWGNDDYYVQVEMDPAGNTSYADMGTSQLLSVPYAMYAANAGVPGVAGPTGPIGPTGSTGPLVAGTNGQTLRNDGSTWEASSTLVNSGTNVGIGTSSPTSTLHVVSTGSEIARFESSGSSKWISLYEGSTRKGILWSSTNDIVLRADETTGNLRFQTNGNNNRMTIDALGNVGVGTSSPSNLFQVDGPSGGFDDSGIRINNTSASSGWSFYPSSGGDMFIGKTTNLGTFDGTSGSYTATSDARLKTNIKSLESVLDKVMSLDVKRYEYIKNNPKGKEFIGVLAQDLHKLYPEFVSINTSNEGNPSVDNQMGVDYGGLSVLAIKALQEQQVLIEQLQAEIELFKKK